MDRDRRIEVFKETMSLVLDGGYTIGDKKIKFDESDFPKTKSFNVHPDVTGITPNHEGMTVEVINSDCLYAAEQYVKDGNKVCVLNMASFIKPGGGVLKGSAAQEENLFRRTNLFRSLYRYSEEMFKYTTVEKPLKAYPMPINYGAIYSPSVTVFRYSEDRDYALMKDPFMVDIISVAAIRKPHLDEKGHFTKWVKDATKSKISMMLDIPMINGVDVLVLSSFGCGAFGNPPQEMAMLFKEVLDEPKYKNHFKKVVFAILDDHNAHREHNPEGNLKPFINVFSKK